MFAEVALFREPMSHMADPRGRPGVPLGIVERANEFFVSDRTEAYVTRSAPNERSS